MSTPPNSINISNCESLFSIQSFSIFLMLASWANALAGSFKAENTAFTGAGIKDQDRNIISNQRLIIDFLQSVATLLAKGKDPRSVPGSGRKKRKRNDEDSDEEEDAGGRNQDFDVDDSVACDIAEQESGSFRRPPPTKGTVLITLRDTAPYTLW
jgi:25S rRNA (uracil2634-N3)-methyltransferase